MANTQRGRPVYGGKYADFHNQIALTNNSAPVKNADVISAAEQSRKQFYQVYDEAVSGIALENDPGKQV